MFLDWVSNQEELFWTKCLATPQCNPERLNLDKAELTLVLLDNELLRLTRGWCDNTPSLRAHALNFSNLVIVVDNILVSRVKEVAANAVVVFLHKISKADRVGSSMNRLDVSEED